jgi:uncharacterized protein YggU (UPF0235/DUF167 family)
MSTDRLEQALHDAGSRGHQVSALRFAVRVRPGASRTAVGGRWDGPTGAALVVAVTAPAVEGKANAAVLAALAVAFGARPRRLAIVAGEHGRDKVVELLDAPPGAADVLRHLLAGTG